jgi:polyisoprenoid-binding protein YceI
MRIFSSCCAAIALATVALTLSYQLNHHGSQASILPAANASSSQDASNNRPAENAAGSYRLDASQSKFIAHAIAGGLFWFQGHDHLVAVRDFSGEARLDPNSITASSLEITAKAGSMVETSSVFTEPQKQIIDKELRDIVLEPDKYPEIVFRSTVSPAQLR